MTDIKQIILDVSALIDARHLDQVIEVAQARRRVLVRRHALGLLPGAIVTFGANVNPTYLTGLTAVIRRVNGKTVSVETPKDPRYRRFAGHRALRVPFTFIVP